MHNILKYMLLSFSLLFFTACSGGNTGNDVQDTAIDKIKTYATNNGSSAVPTLQDYLDAGVEGVNEENIATINDVIIGLTAEDVDTQEKIQALADEYSITIPDTVIPTPSVPMTPSTPVTPENITPVATAQSITVDEDSVGNSIVLSGTDANGDTLSYIIVTSPSHGTLTGFGSTYLYAPNANYTGADSFTFKVNDGNVDSATVTVSITVTNLAEPILTRRDTGLDGVCATYTDKSGEDLNFNGILDDEEVTTTNATEFTNGTPISITDLETMIQNNEDVTSVNTCKITNMYALFSSNGTFNQDIGNWNTGAVTNMSFMFRGSSFNQDIGNWDTGAVTNMSFMFEESSFNQDISAWDTSMVTNMNFMFSLAFEFNQDISAWDVDGVVEYFDFRFLSPLTDTNTPPKFLGLR